MKIKFNIIDNNSKKNTKKDSFNSLKKKIISVEEGTRKAFFSVKKEFEEHLESINENTNEIQSNYESILRVESRLDKMEGMINEINRFIKQFKNQNVYFLDEDNNDSFNIMPLTLEEKQVFKTMYELELEGIKITYSKLADICGISTSASREYVSSLIEKGIPVIKNFLHQKVYLNLEPKFKEIQIKQNILNI